MRNILQNYSCFTALVVMALLRFNGPAKAQSTADLVILNANIYTVDAAIPHAEALAVNDGRILAVGPGATIEALIGADSEVIDAQGNFIMPGFIEGHGHFSGLGSSLQELNFLESVSWSQIVDAVAAKVEKASPGEWIVGRGWHQEKWRDTIMATVFGYPYNDALSAISPDNPVMLEHASGHALIANAKAMDLAGVGPETPDPAGGHIVRDRSGAAIGVFEENAADIIEETYREYLMSLSEDDLLQKWYQGLQLAQDECLRNGVTSFQDAGSSLAEINRYRQLAEVGDLRIRLWAMVRHEFDYLKGRAGSLPILDAGNGFFTCRAVKISIDGALGSYGAWLLEPYDDNPGFLGQNTRSMEELHKLAELSLEQNLQLCVHAIGDRANREVLDAYQQIFNTNGVDGTQLRWRIEHAQHLHPDDIPRFSELGVIASMQGIHCTSDAPFVVKRLGVERARDGAYAWRSLLDHGAIVTNGTDAPVEKISPTESFYASVTRKRIDSGLEFFPGQRMTREEAIYSYTMANAYAAFEEDDKGSLSPGKMADIVILSNDLLRCAEEEIPGTSVLLTVVGGKVAYRNPEFH